MKKGGYYLNVESKSVWRISFLLANGDFKIKVEENYLIVALN